MQMVLDPALVGTQPKRLLLRKDGYLPYMVVQGTSEADVRQVIVLVAGPAAVPVVASGEAPALPPVATIRLPSSGSKGPSKSAPAASPSRTAPQIRVER